MKTGTVVELGERLSGFIKRQDAKENIFFHSDDLVGVSFGSLKKGDRLSFDVVNNKNGSYATQVKRSA